MASSGPNSPSTTANDASVGTVAWSNVANVVSSNNTYATVNTRGVVSNYVVATGFGFSIPAGATIDGIVVEWECKDNGFPDNQDKHSRIVKGGTIGSTNKATGGFYNTTDTYRSYGGASDLWGETWSATDINASNFGAALSVGCDNAGGGVRTVSCDHVRITVYYTTSSQAGRSMQQFRMRR